MEIQPGSNTMIKVDHFTYVHSQYCFARICVEIDLERKFIPKVIMKAIGLVLNIKYEGLHDVCFGCGKYGHKVSNCFNITSAPSNSETTVQTQFCD